MNQSNTLPFIKNRYYKGKLLTSRDFEAEQQYQADKAHFMNRILTGQGVLCGLGVQAMDDKTLLVESGAAIDALGREIVIETNQAVKLSALEGFSKIDGTLVDVYVKYREKETEPVYVAGTEQESENNRVEEGYQLYLANHVTRADATEPFLRRLTLFEDENFAVEVLLPDTVCSGYDVNLDVVVTGKNEFGKMLCFEADLSSPALIATKEEAALHILLEDIKVQKGEKKVFSYSMEVAGTTTKETSLIVASGSMKVFVDGDEKEGNVRAGISFAVSDKKPFEVALSLSACDSLDSMRCEQEDVLLATVALSLTAATYMIEAVDESGKAYVPVAGKTKLRAQYESYFTKSAKEVCVKPDEEVKTVVDPLGRHITTGLLEIPLGNGGREGETYYSGEIMHGLGCGNVYVEIGLDSIYEDASGQSGQATIFGDSELFRDKKSGVAAKCATMVYNDKGSFVAAVKLLEDVNLLVLTYRWIAISLEGDDHTGFGDALENQSISAVTPTIVLSTKESHFFQVQFHNMKPCSLSYELTEPGYGDITADGVFTAPSREGVYEIKIYCSEKPFICTYAYAIVKKTV